MDEVGRSEGVGSLIELWLGRQVVVQHLAATADERRPAAKREEMFLAAYNAVGAEVQRSAEEAPLFIPWSAILSVRGPSRGDIERERHERQELMDQLSTARTSSEMDKARAAAESWLSTHPADGDVRLAYDQLARRLQDEQA